MCALFDGAEAYDVPPRTRFIDCFHTIARTPALASFVQAANSPVVRRCIVLADGCKRMDSTRVLTPRLFCPPFPSPVRSYAAFVLQTCSRSPGRAWARRLTLPSTHWTGA